MKYIINLTNNPKQFCEKVLSIYNKNYDILELSRGREMYSVKLRSEDGINILADVIVAPDCYRFHVAQESSALIVKNPLFAPFDVGISIKNQKLKYHSLPSQKSARDWLYFSNGKNADRLIGVATVCQMIWSFLLPCMKEKKYGDITEYAPRDDFSEFVEEWLILKRKEYRENYRLDGWDVVNLTDKQLSKIVDTMRERNINNSFTDIPIHRFCLALYCQSTKSTQYYFIEQKDGLIHFDIEDTRSSSVAHGDVEYSFMDNERLSLSLKDDTNAMEWLTQTEEDANSESITRWEWMVDVFFTINSFILHFGDVAMEVETKVASKHSDATTNSRKGKRNSVRLFKTYNLSRDWKTKARKKAEITCPAWGVRGHFRHYRNGKVVFVESYVKGPDKAKYKGKEYSLLPYSEA